MAHPESVTLPAWPLSLLSPQATFDSQQNNKTTKNVQKTRNTKTPLKFNTTLFQRMRVFFKQSTLLLVVRTFSEQKTAGKNFHPEVSGGHIHNMAQLWLGRMQVEKNVFSPQKLPETRLSRWFWCIYYKTQKYPLYKLKTPQMKRINFDTSGFDWYFFFTPKNLRATSRHRHRKEKPKVLIFSANG